MKLHLPKRLLTALIADISFLSPAALTLGSAAWGDTSTTIEESLTLSGTSDDTVYFYTSGTIPENSSAKYIVAINGSANDNGTGRININGVANTIPEGAILVAAAGVKADGTAYTGGELYFNRWHNGQLQGNLTIKNEIILGSSTYKQGAMRLNDSKETSKIILQGDITLAADSKIFNAGDFNYIEGAINGEGKELILDNNGKLYLSGGANLGTLQNNVNLYLSATKSDGTTQADATDYTVGSITGNGAVYVGSGTSLTITSGGVAGALSNDGTLVIGGSNADTNGTLLTKATGTGDVEITAATTVPTGGSSQLTGKLTINGATLNMNAGLGNSYNLSSFTSGEWKGATINYHALGSTFQNVTVSGDEASYIKIKDMGQAGASDRPAPIILSGTTTLNKNLEVSSTEWKYSVKIEKLTGNGNLTFNGSTKDHLFATIESFNNYGGAVSFTSTATGKTKELTLGKDASSILNFATNSSVTASTGTTTLIKGQVTGNATISGDRIDIEALLAGSASISGNTINISSNQEIGGVVSLTGTTLSLAGVTVLNGGNLSIEGSTTFTNTITNAGTLSLNGNLSINDITRLEVAEGTTATFSDGSHGYLNATYKVVDNTGTVTLNGATLNGLTLSGGGNGDVNVMIETSSGDYYVNSASEALVYNTDDTVTSKVAADSTTGIILSGGNLKMVTGLNAAATSGITAVRDSTINLGGDVTLNQSDLHLSGGTITLTGSGTYNLGSGITELDSGISLDSSWTGTVKLSGITGANGLDIASCGNAGSKVEMNGVSGWFQRTDSGYNTHVVLTGNGMTMTAYSTNNSYYFNKGISGNGDFIISGASESNPTIKIGANTGANEDLVWSGAFKVNAMASNYHVYLELKDAGSYFDADNATSGVQMNSAGALGLKTGNASGGTTIINGAITNDANNDNVASGTLDVTVVGNTEFNKNVTVSSVTVNSGKTATMNATLKAGSVTNSGELKLADKATISGGTMSNVQMSSTEIASTTAGSKGEINNALVQLARDASFTIQDMTLTGTTSISATEGTAKVTLNNVTATSHLKLNATAANSFVAAGGDESGSISYSYGLGLGSAVAGTNSITLNLNVTDIVQPTDSGLYTLTVTLSNFAGTGFDGLDVDAWKALVGFDQESWLGQALSNATVTADVTATADTGSGVPTVNYGFSAGEGGSVGTLTITISGLNVPEPASATLGLAALMMLCARRRRND